MASKKQLAWRKKFAKMAKAGKFKKSKKKSFHDPDDNIPTPSKKGAKYMIIRFYRDENIPSKVIRRDLTLAQARKHTNDPKTMKKGVWFDGYDEQIETELTPPFAMTSDDPNTLYRPDTGDW